MPNHFWDSLLIAGQLALRRACVAVHLLRPTDGWRKTCGVAMRSEGSKFVLTSFALDFWSDTSPPASCAYVAHPGVAARHLAQRLAAFLRTEPVAHLQLEDGRDITWTKPAGPPIVVLASYGKNGDLFGIATFAQPDEPAHRFDLAEELRLAVESTIVWVTNRTRSLGDYAWRERFDQRFAHALEEDERLSEHIKAAADYAQQVLGGVWLSCLESPPADRFASPDFTLHRPVGPVLLNMVARFSPERRTADLWVQAHHVGIDALPLQEMLARLETQWGCRGEVIYPSEAQSRRRERTQNCAVSGHRSMEHLLGFVDFRPLLSWRRQMLRQIGGQIENELPLSAALLWVLTHEPTLARARFAVAVEVPAGDCEPRSVNFVVIRPADYRGQDLTGFIAFVRDFNAQVRATRQRQSQVYRNMSMVCLLPARLVRRMLQLYPQRTRQTFGTVGLSMLREAKVFIGSMADIGFDDGFLAIGSMGLPSDAGSPVGAVCLKGPTATLGGFLEVLRHALATLEWPDTHEPEPVAASQAT